MSNRTSEFDALFFYLTGQPPLSDQINQYQHGIDRLKLSLNTKEEEMLAWAISKPFRIRILDVGLNFNMKKSNLKERFALAAAIVECDTRFFDRFLNTTIVTSRSSKVILLGLQSVSIFLIAYIIFKIKRWN
jgi:hypothetical protein